MKKRVNKKYKRYSEKRPWGNFEQFTLNEKTTIKILTIKPKQKFSLQYHKKRKEFWRFLDNPAKVTLGKKIIHVKKGDDILIPVRTNHRIEAYGKPVRVLEISYGNFDESDIKRLEDIYRRI